MDQLINGKPGSSVNSQAVVFRESSRNQLIAALANAGAIARLPLTFTLFVKLI